MRVRVGTSGFSYPEWRGSFYPAKFPTAKMLAFYAGRFDAVEINNTFYRMPKPSALEGWAAQVTAAEAKRDFAFTLKAPVYLGLLGRGRIGLEQPAKGFFEIAAVLGKRLGPIYVQLAPTMKKDVEGLAALLSLVPKDVRLAVEPGNETWLDDEVFALLRKHRAALCAVDDPNKQIPVVATAPFGYVRLRRTKYPKAALAAWAARLTAQTSWREAWVFFKHEDAATGPRLATAFQRVLDPER
jgi:uncharacterized protein YecE (DUF72 family)